MKKRMFMSVMVLMLVLGLLSACSSTTSQKDDGDKASEPTNAKSDEYEAVNIRLAYNLPQDHHISRGIEDFAKKVKERSNGKVNIQVYPAGQLLTDKEMNQSILTGGVEMGVNSSTLWSSVVPAMGIFDVPFIFPNYQLAGKALTGEVGQKLNSEMEKKGAKVLIYADYGYLQFANNVRQLKTPADFKGLKIRSTGDIPSEMIKAYGASPVFMGGGEVYMALQRNTVDGATSGTTAMLQRKYDEVAKYLTVSNYSYLEFLLAVNKPFWDKLPAKTQQLIQDTAHETELWIREQAENEDTKSAKELEEKGMDIYVVPEKDLAKWKEAAKPAWDAYLKQSGDLGKELIEAVEKDQ